jgi:predicted metal-dependent hydrolase
VTRDNQVRITVPSFLSQKKIQEIIENKSDWIAKQIQKNAARKSKQFISGEKFLYLGKEYELAVTNSNRGSVSLFEKNLSIAVIAPQGLSRSHKEINEGIARSPEGDAATSARDCFASLAMTAKVMLEDWYINEAEKIFSERVVLYEKLMGVRAVSVKIKASSSRWGSCSSTGRLILNWKIIMAPLEIVDYVIVHELAHLLHLNHSARFWSVVSRILPNYKAHRRWLAKHGDGLTID